MNSKRESERVRPQTAGLPSPGERTKESHRPWSNHLVPDITKFKRTSSCLQRDRDHGLLVGLPAPAKPSLTGVAAVTADPPSGI